MCELGWPLADAWCQQSVIPAAIIGITLPTLAVGEQAEFVISRYSREDGLLLEQVVDMGKELLSRPVGTRTVDV
jgi:hypothetical protein